MSLIVNRKNIMERIKYINNKDLLLEIHRSKNSYCFYKKPEYANYDIIVNDLSTITDELLEQTLIKKKETIIKKGSLQYTKEEAEHLTKNDLIIRLMTEDHMPKDLVVKKRKKINKFGEEVRLCFPPFKHYKLENNEFIEVGRSHWKGDLETGHFCVDHGKISNRLAMMFMLLVERYSKRGNWRGYSYVDEMKSHALLQLSQIGLQFDESKSDNPFAFYTQVIKNCLSGETEILTKEYGSIPIAEVSEQDVHLLDGNGEWVKCHIYDHGIQETQLTYFQNNGGNKIGIWSTVNHGWISEGKIIETKDFAGHNTTVDDLRPNKIIKNKESYQKGIIHGLVYGDYPLYNSNDEDFKLLPKEPNKDLDYLLGFIRGWFSGKGLI